MVLHVRQFGHQHFVAQLQSETTKGKCACLNVMFKNIGNSNLKMVDAEGKHLNKATAAHEKAQKRYLTEVTLKAQLGQILQHMKKEDIEKIKSQLDEKRFVRDLVNLHYKFAKTLEATEQVSKEKQLLAGAIAAEHRAREMIIAKGGSIRIDENPYLNSGVGSILDDGKDGPVANSGESRVSPHPKLGGWSKNSMMPRKSSLSVRSPSQRRSDVETIFLRDPTTNPVMHVILQRCESGKLHSGTEEGEAAEIGRGVVAYVSFSGGEDCNAQSETTQRWIQCCARSLLTSPVHSMHDQSIFDFAKGRTSTDLVVVFQADRDSDAHSWEQVCQTMSPTLLGSDPTPKLNHRNLLSSFIEHLQLESCALLYGFDTSTCRKSERNVQFACNDDDAMIETTSAVQSAQTSYGGSWEPFDHHVSPTPPLLLDVAGALGRAQGSFLQTRTDSPLTDSVNSPEITPRGILDEEYVRKASLTSAVRSSQKDDGGSREPIDHIPSASCPSLLQVGTLNIIQGFSSQVLYLKLHGASAETFMM